MLRPDRFAAERSVDSLSFRVSISLCLTHYKEDDPPSEDERDGNPYSGAEFWCDEDPLVEK